MATTAAALSARARRQIQHHFFAADAVRSDRALAFEPGNGFERRHFERLREAGAIHEEGPGRYWLDLPVYDEWLRRRHSRVRIVLAAVIVVLAASLILTRSQIGA
jgi:hypothetical protein